MNISFFSPQAEPGLRQRHGMGLRGFFQCTIMEQIAHSLNNIARKDGKDVQVVFADFLDYIIDCFSLERLVNDNGDYQSIFQKIKDEKSVFFPVFAELIMKSPKLIEDNGVYDFFGNIYEIMFQSNRKAVTLGQFFTPQSVSNLCSHIMHKEVDGECIANEPTCGSGRNLLALFCENKNKAQYYIAEDLDSVSVKMCTINMTLHGIRGCCICHNTLFPSEFIFGYEINEVRYPFPCEYYSIRPISNSEYKNRLAR